MQRSILPRATRNPRTASLLICGFAFAASVGPSVSAYAQNGITKQKEQTALFGGGADEQRLIANICGTQLPTLDATGCSCVAEEAMTALDQPQRNYLILSVVQPQAADRTETAKSLGDLQTIAAFIDKAGKDCAAPGSVAPTIAPAAPVQ